MTRQHTISTSAGASLASRLVRRHWKVAAALLAAVVFQLALVASFTGAEARPELHQVTVGLVGTAQASPAVGYQHVASAAAARQAVRDGTLPAALVVSGDHETLITSEAAGLTLTAAIEQVATAQAAAAHASLAVADVRPLPPGDPRGLATFLLVLGWIIGGYLGMTLLSRALGARARGLRGTATLAAWTAAYAVASAGLGVLVTDPFLGAVTGHPWALLGAGTLIVFAAAMTTAALLSLFGMAGIIVAVVAFVVLGNPTSGGSVPAQMLSAGYRVVGEVLPNSAGISLVHAIQYFGGNGTGHPILVLALYAAIALAVCCARACRQRPAAGGGVPAAPALARVAR
jgi:hypothetical protein